jgi:hypothetical protein
MVNFKRLLFDARVEKNYVSTGTWVGDAVSQAYMGEPLGMASRVDKWASWEVEYARRGFRTVSLDRFVGLGGYGKHIDDAIGQKRDAGEEPILHAEIYKQRYLGRVQPAIDIERMFQDGKPQLGIWIRPSTED